MTNQEMQSAIMSVLAVGQMDRVAVADLFVFFAGARWQQAYDCVCDLQNQTRTKRAVVVMWFERSREVIGLRDDQPSEWIWMKDPVHPSFTEIRFCISDSSESRK